jgi:hypothetical protein
MAPDQQPVRVAVADIAAAVEPPSTWIVVPVMWRAGSEARKTTSAATSSGAARRPKGMRCASSASTSSSGRPAASARPL